MAQKVGAAATGRRWTTEDRRRRMRLLAAALFLVAAAAYDAVAATPDPARWSAYFMNRLSLCSYV